jgi:hypothetical protein
MLGHRKLSLTLTSGPEMAPSVVFPAFPRRQEHLTMPGIACAFFPSGKTGKTISAAPYCLNML